jgi:3-hydroxyisobutyrate dehydrogenase-like beta-hydroxyacid dehydrogenase
MEDFRGKSMNKKIGLIGIGLVGTALAENLLAANYEVVGFDILEDKRTNLARRGGVSAATLEDAIRHVERVILSLPDSEVVEEVIQGPQGPLTIESPLKFIIDTTTGAPDKTQVLAKRLQAKGIHFLDATLSGSSEQIRNRQGVFMIGGERWAYEANRDLFSALAETYFYLGPSGSGSKAKLASNLILGLNRLVLAEGLVFAKVLGLDAEAFLEMAKSTPAYSCAMDVKGKKMLQEDFTPQSKITQHDKDLRIILEYAHRSGQELPLTRVHKEILEDAIASGDGELDTCAVIKHLRRLHAQ